MAKSKKNHGTKSKKIAGFVILILGICAFVFGTVVSAKVKEGECKINKSQRGVNTARGFSRIDPLIKQIGKVATRPIQRKINQGKVSAGKYKTFALLLRIGGLVLFVGGAALMLFGFKKKSKR